MKTSFHPLAASLLATVIIAPIASVTACGSSDSPALSTGTGASSQTGTTGTGVGGGSGGGSDGGSGGGSVGPGGGGGFVPTLDDIGFENVNPMPKGEQIVFNDWTFGSENVSSVTPDGQTKTEIFRASRVWSMGVSQDGSKIAFSCCGNETIQKHYDIPSNFGDVIQHTWIYDTAGETATVAAYGNINDECYRFSPKNTSLYICRRYDFVIDGSSVTNKGYRIGKIDLTTLDHMFLTDEVDDELHLHPEITSDESEMYFTTVILGASQSREIRSIPLPPGPPKVIRTKADSPALSPNGTRYLYRDYNDGGAIYSSLLDGSNAIKVSDEGGSGAVWSPDGTKVAYLRWDNSVACSHIQVVAADGSDANDPVRLRDCGDEDESPTDIGWIIH